MPEQRQTNAQNDYEELPTPSLFKEYVRVSRTKPKLSECQTRETTSDTGNDVMHDSIRPKQDPYKWYLRSKPRDSVEIKLSTPVESKDSEKPNIVTSIPRDSPSFAKSSNVLPNVRESIIGRPLSRQSSLQSQTVTQTDRTTYQLQPSQGSTRQQPSSPHNANRQNLTRGNASTQYASQNPSSQQRASPRDTSQQHTSPRDTSQQHTSPQDTSQQQMRRKKNRRKRGSNVIKRSEDIDNYVGNKPIDEVLQYIQS